ncbi:MAG: GldG family protein [Candidatus Binatia bacterium]|nr:GldG family protein [Candidatus Binatia bacterium]
MARDTVGEAIPSAFALGGVRLSREWTRRVLLLGLEIVFLIVIVVSLETLLARANRRFDLTPEKKFSLSPLTVQALGVLQEPVQVTVFYRRGEREKHDELLRLMEAENPLFSYQLFDLDRAPGLAQRYGITAYGAAVIESGGKRITLPIADEERLLNALLRVSQEEKTIYFLVGHGENDPGDAEERAGYGVVRQVLETENYRVRPLPLFRTKTVPPDADLLIISGPKDELAPEELDALSAYLQAGGNAIFMLDPYTVPGLTRYLGQFGFALADDVVVDEHNQVAGGEPLMPVISTFSQEVFPRNPRGEPLLPVVRPVRVQDSQAQPFAFSSRTSWALKGRERIERGELRFREGEDERGPLPVAAVAATGQEKKGKIVVLGDSDFVNNFYARVPGNMDFFMNTVGWILDRPELLSIGRSPNVPMAKRVATPQQSLYLTAAQSRLFFWLMVVLEPAAVFLVGVAVFIWRRKRG